MNATEALLDEEWVQYGAPNSNRNRPGINPAFPGYPSGHASFSSAMLSVLKEALQVPGTVTLSTL